jgi:hypothetical protein
MAVELDVDQEIRERITLPNPIPPMNEPLAYFCFRAIEEEATNSRIVRLRKTQMRSFG